MSRLSADARWKRLLEVVRASARPGQPAPLFAAVESALGAVAGHKLFTLMVLHHDRGEAERIHTSHPEDYPVSGRKPMTDTPWSRQVLGERRHFLGRTREDVRRAFPDHELIERLGCRSAINVLAVHDGVVVGSANLLHEEGHYTEDDIQDCLPFVQLLIPAFRSFAGEK